jgi:predicted transcriptional regulator
MSPRAALRLETLGFRYVYDYVPGKVDWLAHGLPREGASAGRATAGDVVHHDVPRCGIDESIQTVAQRIAASDYSFAVVLGPNDVLLGRVRKSALEDATGTVAAVMESGPSTIRPHSTIKDVARQMRNRDLRTMLVTTPEGHWLGAIRREDVEARATDARGTV